MADLPANVSEMLMTSHVNSALQTAADARATASLASQTLQVGAAGAQNTLGLSAVARATSGINATPLASPVEVAGK